MTDESNELKASPLSTKVKVAKLDANSIFQGVEEIDGTQVTPDHVHLPRGCDLPPGKYRWDKPRKTFVPLDTPEEAAMKDPYMLNAIAIGLAAIHMHSIPLPPETLAWLDYHFTSIDASGCCTNKETALMITAYMKRNAAKEGK